MTKTHTPITTPSSSTTTTNTQHHPTPLLLPNTQPFPAPLFNHLSPTLASSSLPPLCRVIWWIMIPVFRRCFLFLDHFHRLPLSHPPNPFTVQTPTPHPPLTSPVSREHYFFSSTPMECSPPTSYPPTPTPLFLSCAAHSSTFRFTSNTILLPFFRDHLSLSHATTAQPTRSLSHYAKFYKVYLYTA